MIGQIIQNLSFKSGLRAFEEEMDRDIFLAIGDLTASCNFLSIHILDERFEKILGENCWRKI